MAPLQFAKGKAMKFETSAVLCAALLATGCVSQQKYNTEVQQVDTLSVQKQTADELNQKLSTEVKNDQVQIQQLKGQLKVTVANELLFPEGGYTLNAKGEESLAKMAPTLAALKGQQIVIEGFTDNVPIGPALRERFPSNWELSTARATDVLRYLSSKGVPSSMLSAQGFGDSRPVASNDTPSGRAKNRRVEIVITAATRP
jgi:chemotaxis protein MotB